MDHDSNSYNLFARLTLKEISDLRELLSAGHDIQTIRTFFKANYPCSSIECISVSDIEELTKLALAALLVDQIAKVFDPFTVKSNITSATLFNRIQSSLPQAGASPSKLMGQAIKAQPSVA